ncbi:MAG: extracellular solute-binding protein [Deltaproteobacteria bacterium]|nr:MAG: extracellular solute-binding protein [Deltaproteobacteria bacterium]
MLFMTHPWDGCRANGIRAKKQFSLNWKASRLPIRFSKTKRPRNSWTTALSLSSIVTVSSPSCSNPKITVNMARINKYPWTLIIIAIFTFVDVRPTRAASVEERLDQVNRMAEKDRAETVEREARKEGELIWYAAMASDRAGELIKAFESKYPFVKIRFQPGGAGRQLEQLLVEHRTKKPRADIINTRRSYVGVMAKAGAVARYRTPLRASLRDGFTDKEGFVNGIYAQPRVFLFNTRMVARDKAPQSFEDLLDPRWKDKLGMDTTDYDWLASLIDYYGRGKALELAGKLAKQQLNLRRGPTLLAQLAVAGEFPLVIDAFPEEIMQMKSAKAPVDFIFSEPFVPVKTPTTISISSGAPHPHAAALFVDFLLAKAGQDLMAGQGRWVSRKDGSYFADLKGKKMQIPSPDWDDKQVELIKLYNATFGLN